MEEKTWNEKVQMDQTILCTKRFKQLFGNLSTLPCSSRMPPPPVPPGPSGPRSLVVRFAMAAERSCSVVATTSSNREAINTDASEGRPNRSDNQVQ